MSSHRMVYISAQVPRLQAVAFPASMKHDGNSLFLNTVLIIGMKELKAGQRDFAGKDPEPMCLLVEV